MEGASWVEAGYTEALSNYRCVVLDCRGYGSSDKPDQPLSYEVERYVDDQEEPVKYDLGEVLSG